MALNDYSPSASCAEVVYTPDLCSSAMETLRVTRMENSLCLINPKGFVRYTIDTDTSYSWWDRSTVRRFIQTRCPTNDTPEFWIEEIANIMWKYQQTFVMFGTRAVAVDSFLRIDRRFDNSRSFIGPDQSPLRWKMRSGGLELRHDKTKALIAKWHPARKGISVLSIKTQEDAIEIEPAYAKDEKLLDAIVVTWAILDGILHRRDSDNTT
ncbi:hypothetical protein M422DRAFT_35437 [Sphaerobolus stellatus SS14]|uniref:DUF6593 domain-containing protein n=1 Tax=Sphaerobolus stellatus (strain SS14) TaxID=990650 RepID=A0A0C9UFH6_SPHS4|nr:hypothetical protein M422DRAFT_35437 [Sphaerobolus stellatus SS14]